MNMVQGFWGTQIGKCEGKWFPFVLEGTEAWGALRVQSVEFVTLGLRVVSLSRMFGVEIA